MADSVVSAGVLTIVSIATFRMQPFSVTAARIEIDRRIQLFAIPGS